jgi:NitT/TauT family transport system substrate-binding protein
MGSGKKRMALGSLALSIALIVSACSSSGGSKPPPSGATSAARLQKVTLRLDWLPSQEEVPFYLAAAKGFYAQHGIDIEILDGNGSSATIQQVANKENTFGYADGGAIVTSISQGLPVKAIASFYRTSGGAVLSLADSGIKTPKDLAGKTFAGPSYDAFTILLPGLLRANGVDPKSVKIVNVQGNAYIPALLAGQVDATPGIGWREKILAKISFGIDVNVMPYADYGLRLVGFSLIAHPDTIATNPDLVQEFVAASVEGLKYAKDHIEEAAAAMRKFRPDDPQPLDIYVDQIKADYGELNLLNSPATQSLPMGTMAAEDWQSTIDSLFANQVIKKKPDVNNVFTNDFVPGS